MGHTDRQLQTYSRFNIRILRFAFGVCNHLVTAKSPVSYKILGGLQNCSLDGPQDVLTTICPCNGAIIDYTRVKVGLNLISDYGITELLLTRWIVVTRFVTLSLKIKFAPHTF
jgi:hypothetical protein